MRSQVRRVIHGGGVVVSELNHVVAPSNFVADPRQRDGVCPGFQVIHAIVVGKHFRFCSRLLSRSFDYLHLHAKILCRLQCDLSGTTVRKPSVGGAGKKRAGENHGKNTPPEHAAGGALYLRTIMMFHKLYRQRIHCAVFLLFAMFGPSKDTSSTQAMYRSSRRKRQASFTPRCLLSQQNRSSGFAGDPGLICPLIAPPPAGGRETDVFINHQQIIILA